jgi:hypothetical protein
MTDSHLRVCCDRIRRDFAGSKLGNRVGCLIANVSATPKGRAFLRRKNKPKHFPNKNKLT